MLLDSGSYTSHSFSRYDIIVARPVASLLTRGDETKVITDSDKYVSNENPFSLLGKVLGINTDITHNEYPFCGGALGFFGYELQHAELLPKIDPEDRPLADMAIGIYDWAIISDHQQQQTTLVSGFRYPHTKLHWQDLINEIEQIELNPLEQDFRVNSDIESSFSKAAYQEAFQRIQNYLHEGDCYQVNLTQRFSVDVSGSSWGIYQAMRNTNPAPFSAYLNIPGGEVISFSPERFLQVQTGQVETRPIKGTRPRGKTVAEDEQLRYSLINSAKDRAENLMIVDLLRNDISKSCKTGSVHVPSLFALESYANVHHLVSTITAELKADRNAIDLLKDAFPGGSITGAPKIRAMEIIEELEPVARSLYCGSIGYIDYHGNMDTSIAIRSSYRHHHKLYYHAGGGIITDSNAEDEYKELHHKASFFLDFCRNYQKQQN